MKFKTKDENGFPLNFDPSTFYQEPEYLMELPWQLLNTMPGMYLISTWGRIFNKATNAFIPRELIKPENRYVNIALKLADNTEKHFRMHYIMAYMFILPKPISPTGELIVPNHKDGVKWHNEVYNLEWVTESENTKHADRTNLISRPYGEDNGSAKLTDEQYHKICQLTQQGYLANEVDGIMNLGFDITNIVQKIRTGKTLNPIASQYDFSNIPRNDYRKFGDEDVHKICQYLQDTNLSNVEILEAIGYHKDYMDQPAWKKLRDTVSCIKRRVAYNRISDNYKF